ncbi:MAG: hypothetical protein COT84_03065 [Chlamydiae bacterium CG10_big_fil_rev_8_21_14_0_10_35_9]|nr:MAG: hypothetical protein COT84_03065 [Chlamydiae bacterium CG10_big_fil_rev_8_21_14_0_10_35_9]
MKNHLSRPISFIPFKKELKRYHFSTLKQDLFASLSVALLAIPQAIAYSLLAGLPPIAGFYSAIFGTIFASAWGSSRHLVSGPTTGVAILLQTTVADVIQKNYPGSSISDEGLVLQILMHIIFVIGAVQIFSAFFNVGKLLQFVSRSVVLGYFAGVALAIIANQMYYFTGVELGDNNTLIFRASYFLTHIQEVQLGPFILGSTAIGFLFFFKKKLPKVPDALLTLILAGGLAYCINEFLPEIFKVKTLKDVIDVGSPRFEFGLPYLKFKVLSEVFLSSVAISFVAILEVFSVSRNLASKSGQNIYSNQEVFGLGISNLFLAFFPFAIPVSGSASRSSLNFLSGAKTRFASIYSGIFVAIIIFIFWPLVKLIPLSALAALLLLTTFNIVNLENIKLCFRATKSDAFVFCLTMSSCLVFDLDLAFFIGIVISLVFYLKKSAEPHQVEYAFNTAGRLTVVSATENVHRKIRIIGVSGELFFGTVDLFQNTMRTIAKDTHVRAIVLRLTGVYHMDASMCLAILKVHEYLQATNRHLLISGITDEVWKIFHRTQVVKTIGTENLFISEEANPQLSTWKACLRAQDLVSS